jgi:citrate/tricarballylate utilization protein
MMQATTELKQLISQAQQGITRPNAVDEAQRILSICNACRYCEGFCAVFPAMTRRLDFASDDIHYLANLCHNCGACLHACQYAPPHEFAVNVPQTMAKVRLETYQDYAWPAAMAGAYSRNGVGVAIGLSALLAACFALAAQLGGGLWATNGLTGNFYAVFAHNSMALIFGASFVFSLLAMVIGVRRFWGQVKHTTLPKAAFKFADFAQAAHNAATLKYLDGANEGKGDGCNEESDRYTHARRRFHHATAGGFMLCFAATSVATIYHYVFGWQAPYALTSLPVLLGTVGGIGLIIGPVGLLWLKFKRHPLHGDAAQKPMDVAFITLLLLISMTGLALLAWRDVPAMPLLLCLHLGSVLAFFVTLPYGKMVHGVYRMAALFKWAVEKRSASHLKLGAD